MQRPEDDEYDAAYTAYVSRVPTGDVIATLERQGATLAELLNGVSEEAASRSYAPGKWTLKEVVGHVIDTERAFAFRALAFARGDRSAIPGLDQDEWVAAANFADRTLAELLQEARAVRQSTLTLLRGLDAPDIELRRGTASGCSFSVRSLAYIIAGHEDHHVEVLKARYL